MQSADLDSLSMATTKKPPGKKKTSKISPGLISERLRYGAEARSTEVAQHLWQSVPRMCVRLLAPAMETDRGGKVGGWGGGVRGYRYTDIRRAPISRG